MAMQSFEQHKDFYFSYNVGTHFELLLRLPQSKLAILGIGTNQILMRVVANANNVFLVDLHKKHEISPRRGRGLIDKQLTFNVLSNLPDEAEKQ